MLYSVNDLQKKIKYLRENIQLLYKTIKMNSSFLCSSTENIEDNRPKFDLKETLEEIKNNQKDIKHIKHMINLHNATTILEGLDLTIDQALVYLPMLQSVKDEIYGLVNVPVKKRCTRGSGLVSPDYEYTNYDNKYVVDEFKKYNELCSKILTALDCANSIKDIEL